MDAVEYENERLRISSEVDVGGQLKALQSERQEIIDRSLCLEAEISLLESKLAAHASQIETFHIEKKSLTAQVTISQGEALASRLARQQDLDTHAIQLKTLREEIDSHSHTISQKDNIIKSNALVIEQLSADFERVCREFEEERKELGVQIDELRTAGQVSLFTCGCKCSGLISSRKLSLFMKSAFLLLRACVTSMNRTSHPLKLALDR